MENIQNRKRSIDVNKLAKDEADALSAQIGAKVRDYCDEACEKANKILNIYGMKAQMQIVINAIEEKAPEAPKAPQQKSKKKRSSPK